MSSPTWLSCRLALRLGSAGSSGRASRFGECRCLLLLRRRLSALRRAPRPVDGLWLPPAASCLGSPRPLGTHPKKEPMEALNTAQGARDFIYSLHSTERSCLLRELHRFESIAIAQGSCQHLTLNPYNGILEGTEWLERILTWGIRDFGIGERELVGLVNVEATFLDETQSIQDYMGKMAPKDELLRECLRQQQTWEEDHAEEAPWQDQKTSASTDS